MIWCLQSLTRAAVGVQEDRDFHSSGATGEAIQILDDNLRQCPAVMFVGLFTPLSIDL
jgi:hypothetical protein